MIKIDTRELDQFSVRLGKISGEAKNNVNEVIKNSAFKIEANAKKNLTSNKSVITGHLRRGIATDIGNLEATIHTSNIKYAIMVEKGTRAHVIRPKNKKYLYWKGAKYPVKNVNHPGSKAKPYLIPAFEKEKDNFINKLKEAIEW
jgi:HK97 gp10 family phage protein